MSKISLVGLIVSLIVLGGFFFAMGFLVAVGVFNIGNVPPALSWASVNSQQQKGFSAIEKLTRRMGDTLLHDQETKIESRLGGGIISKIVTHVPASLQPFAAQAQNQLTIKTQQHVRDFLKIPPPFVSSEPVLHPQRFLESKPSP